MRPARLQPIEDTKRTITAMVTERIRDAILNGMLAPSSRIDQAQLAADLNVSIVPVREALKTLEAEGFVQILPRRGAFVTDTSVRDMEDLYFTRSVLEGQAAYHAADKIDDDTLERLKMLQEQMTRALHAEDFTSFMHDNREFHFLIYDSTGSVYLSNLIAGLWDLAERYRYRYVFFRNQGDIIQSEHQAILDACIAHDAKALRDAIIHHMNQTMHGVRSYIISRRQQAEEQR
jgi:DNA-binding GntR family transcriptional regulator